MKKNRNLTVVQGKRQNRTGKKLVCFLLAAVAIYFCVPMLYSFGLDALGARFVRTVVVESGVLETLLAVEGVIVRKERVVTAPASGKLEWVVEEGERLSVGTLAARIKTGESTWQAVHTPAPGLIIMQLDGLEGVLQPQSLTEINVPLTRKLPLQQRSLLTGEEVTRGSVLFKMVDNFTWYYLIELSAHEYAGLSERASVTMRFSFTPDQDVTGRLDVVKQEDDKVTISFEINGAVDHCFKERFSSADVVTKRTRGTVLPASALIEQEGETGVYILDKSVVRYRPVDVLDAWQGKVVVSGLRIGFSVITNPNMFREGQRL